jgi:hypothetical protein
MKKSTNRDYPLAPTFLNGDKEKRKSERKEKKIERSTGLEYEPKVRKRHMSK